MYLSVCLCISTSNTIWILTSSFLMGSNSIMKLVLRGSDIIFSNVTSQFWWLSDYFLWRGAFTTLCLEFQKEIDKREDCEVRSLLLEKDSLEHEIELMDKKNNVLKNSVLAFVEEILEDLHSSNSGRFFNLSPMKVLYYYQYKNWIGKQVLNCDLCSASGKRRCFLLYLCCVRIACAVWDNLLVLYLEFIFSH